MELNDVVIAKIIELRRLFDWVVYIKVKVVNCMGKQIQEFIGEIEEDEIYDENYPYLYDEIDELEESNFIKIISIANQKFSLKNSWVPKLSKYWLGLYSKVKF